MHTTYSSSLGRFDVCDSCSQCFELHCTQTWNKLKLRNFLHSTVPVLGMTAATLCQAADWNDTSFRCDEWSQNGAAVDCRLGIGTPQRFTPSEVSKSTGRIWRAFSPNSWQLSSQSSSAEQASSVFNQVRQRARLPGRSSNLELTGEFRFCRYQRFVPG